MERRVRMPLNIQLFAESGEDNNADTQNPEVDDTSKDVKDDAKKETKLSDEKKYSDKELNDISLKNEQKALAKQLKDLGIINEQRIQHWVEYKQARQIKRNEAQYNKEGYKL